MVQPQANIPEFSGPTGALPVAIAQDPSIERTLASVRGHLGIEIAFIGRWVEGQQSEITHLHAAGNVPLAVGQRTPVQDTYCWHVVQGNLPELLRDTASHPLAARLPATTQVPAGCYLGAPLRLSDGTDWGMFCAIGTQPDTTLSERDLNVVRAFAAMAAERIESLLDEQQRLATTRSAVEGMLDGHAISVFQQPIHSLADGKPVGIECLARFPDLKKRGPNSWFDDAESVGLGVELEMAAVRVALETLSHVPEGIFAAINASPKAILSGALAAELQGFEPSGNALVIEVTEHHQVEDFADLRRALDAIRDRALIAIDDVGTGYAGLRHIVDLKPDLLKMDMSLTREVNLDPVRRSLTAALAGFAREIDCVLIAEGIETAEECEELKRIGVDFGQGYFFARPLPVVAAQQHLMGTGFGGPAS